jgi:hypothetical protein
MHDAYPSPNGSKRVLFVTSRERVSDKCCGENLSLSVQEHEHRIDVFSGVWD